MQEINAINVCFSTVQFVYKVTSTFPVMVKLNNEVEADSSVNFLQEKELCPGRRRSQLLYLFELLYLGLLEHGEDIGASLLSSPLSLVRGLLTCLRSFTKN